MNDCSIKSSPNQNLTTAGQAPTGQPQEKPTFERALELIQFQSYDKAISMLEQLDGEDNTNAQNALGDMYFCGIGVKQDDKKAKEYYERSVDDKRDPIALINLGRMQMHQGMTTIGLYHIFKATTACGEFSPLMFSFDGCKKIGDFYQSQGNHIASQNWHKQATDSTTALDGIYASSTTESSTFGQNQANYIASLIWYKRAAELGNSNDPDLLSSIAKLHQLILASALSHLENQDYLFACKELFLLAQEGNLQAQLHLGNMYAAGLGVEQNYKTAYNWYKPLAENGNAEACNAIGVMYYEGLGVDVNLGRARYWFDQAKNKNTTETKDRIDMPSDWQDWYSLKESAESGCALASQRLNVLEQEILNNALFAIEDLEDRTQFASKTVKQMTDQYFAESMLAIKMNGPNYQTITTADAAVRTLEFLAEKGNVTAQFTIGKMFLYGEARCARDLVKAINYLTQAFTNRQPLALLELAKAHYANYKNSFWGKHWPDSKIEIASQENAGAASYRIAKILMTEDKDLDNMANFFLVAYDNDYAPLLSDKDAIEKIFTLSEQYRARSKNNPELFQKAERLLKIAVDAKYQKALTKLDVLEKERALELEKKLALQKSSLEEDAKRQELDTNNKVVNSIPKPPSPPTTTTSFNNLNIGRSTKNDEHFYSKKDSF